MRKVTLIITAVGLLYAGCAKVDSQVVVQSISFTPDTLTIRAGKSIQLSPVFTPSAFSSIPVKWSSADTTVATISSQGFLNAVKPGKIWIKIQDKNSATAGKCYIIVQTVN